MEKPITHEKRSARLHIPNEFAQDLKKLLVRNVLVLILIAFGAAFALLSPHFLTQENLTNVARQVAYVGIIAVGMTIAILTAGIDLSVGSVLALTGCVFAGLMNWLGWSPLAAFLSALALGAFLGSVSGFLIAYLNVTPIIATLGMMGIARGLANVYTAGAEISGLPRVWDFFGTGSVLSIPTPVIIWLGIVLIGWFALSRTTFGRSIYALGGSTEGARLAGVNVRLYTVLPYVITGVCSALSGVLLVARLGSANSTLAVGTEFDAISAVVLGGTRLYGGRGGVLGTVLGTILMGMLRNIMNLLGFSSWYQSIVIGILLVVAIAITFATEREEGDA